MYDADWTALKTYKAVEDEATLAASTKAEGSDTGHLSCDICELQNSVCYCVDCGQKLCDEHFKVCPK